ncbi:MAG TPA: hypothetical protein VFA84_10965 [Acidimicrobiales bacterium]|nr:hypothetical protein [Acidimicrobiales bacterium]
MTRAVVVRYRAREDAADENERLIRAVFDELASRQPPGLRYSAFRVDGNSFVHVAVIEGDDNPLDTLPAFQAFVAGVGARCEEGPSPAGGWVVGSYP